MNNHTSRASTNNFNLLRVVAAWLVLFSHSFHLSGMGAQEPLLMLSNGKMTFGTLAVGVFFAASGYLITASAYARPSFISFLEARVRRIFPALIVVTAGSAFVLGPFLSTLSVNEYFLHQSTFSYFVRNITLLRLQWDLPGVFEGNAYGAAVNGSLWTLPVEFGLYLAVGLSVFILKLGSLGTQKVVLLGVVGVVVLLCWMFVLLGTKSGAALLIPYFLMGAAIQILGRNFVGRGLIPLALFIAAVVCVEVDSRFFPVFACLAISCGTLWIAENGKWVVNYPVEKIGDLSYGIYLFAFPVQQAVIAMEWASNPWGISIIATLIVVPLSWASWHFVEQRFLSKRRLENASMMLVALERQQ